MSAKTTFIITNLIGLLGALFFYANAHEPIMFTFLGLELSTNPGYLVLITYVSGAMLGATSMTPFLSDKGKKTVAKLQEWKEQDAKLAVEVQSDKEKQLEAKIATLEAALKQALGK